MAIVWIPALLRDLTDGQERVTVPGETVRQVIENLNERFPGFRDRLLEGDRLRPGLAVVVDGEISRERLRRRLAETSEIHFVPAISGGE